MNLKTTKNNAESNKKKSGKKITPILIVIIVIFTILILAVRIKERLKKVPPAGTPAITVETIKITARPFSVTKSYSGTVEAVKRASIAAQLNGQLEKILFREGQKVSKGALLITLDDSEFRAEMERLKATGKQIKSDLAFWRLENSRNEKLLEGNAIPLRKRDESLHKVASLEASLKANEFAVKAAETRLGYTKIYAPFSGTVQKIYTETGEFAHPGKILVDLVATDSMKAVFSIPQTDVALLSALMKNADSSEKKPTVLLKIRALKTDIATSISHLYPAMDFTTRNAFFDVVIPANMEEILPGMSIDAEVILSSVENALTIPPEALRFSKGTNGVYLVRNNQAQWSTVRTGQSGKDRILVKSGIKEGDEIIISPDPRLKEGSKIRVNNRLRSSL